jgi:hypothetical protein
MTKSKLTKILEYSYQPLYDNSHSKEILLSLNAFKTTVIELNAIAIPAYIGFSRIPKIGYKKPAATGIPIKLYT